MNPSLQVVHESESPAAEAAEALVRVRSYVQVGGHGGPAPAPSRARILKHSEIGAVQQADGRRGR